MKTEVRFAERRARASSSVRRVTLAAIALVVVAGWFAWQGAFLGDHDVDVKVTFSGIEGTELRRLRLIAGADKAYWPVLRAGETARTRLFTGGEETSLVMQLALDGEHVSWHGPTVAIGAGYRIAIEVDAMGRVTERHCLLPCPWWW